MLNTDIKPPNGPSKIIHFAQRLFSQKRKHAFRKQLSRMSEICSLVKGVSFYLLCSTQQQLRNPKKKYQALEMEEFIILHQIPSQRILHFIFFYFLILPHRITYRQNRNNIKQLINIKFKMNIQLGGSDWEISKKKSL